MEGHICVIEDSVAVPTQGILYGLIPAMGGTTAYAVSTAYLAYIDVYRELPSTIALAKITGLTRQTVAKAMKDAEAAGLNLKELGEQYIEEYA